MLINTNQDSTTAIEIPLSPKKTSLLLVDELKVTTFGPETYSNPSLGD